MKTENDLALAGAPAAALAARAAWLQHLADEAAAAEKIEAMMIEIETDAARRKEVTA